MADFGVTEIMAAVAAATSVAGAGLSGAAGYQSAKANAAAAQAEADAAAQQTKMEQAAQEKQSKDILSKQRAVAAASGVSTTSGSPLELALNSAYEGELNRLQIGYAGGQKQAGLRYQAGAYGAQGSSALFGGMLGAGKSLLSAYAYDVFKPLKKTRNTPSGYAQGDWSDIS